MLGFVELDPLARAHLVRAIEAHRLWCRANGVAMPAVLDRIAVSLPARSGQERTNLDCPADAGHGAAVLLTAQDVAARLAVSERTVRRLVSSGALAAVQVGGRRRIRSADLDVYIDGLEAT